MSRYNAPFTEQVDFFLRKTAVPTQRWSDVWQEAHDRAFMVAGAQGADLLADLQAAVAQAIVEGTGLEAFRAQFKAIVAEHGWTGWTGEGSPEGVAWRTRVIYQTNMATSYAAGRYLQLTDPDFALIYPYWRYKHADGILHPRPLHVAWDGLTLPKDHPFWSAHYPPNGWGCHCRAIGATRDDFVRAVAKGRGPTDAPDNLDGIDKGFAYAPGRSVAAELRALRDGKVAQLPAPIAADLSAAVADVFDPPQTLDEFIAAGKRVVDRLPDPVEKPFSFRRALIELLDSEVGISKPCRTASSGQAAATVRRASQFFPDSWTAAADDFGALYVAPTTGRAYAYSWTNAFQSFRGAIPGWPSRNAQPGDGYIKTRIGDLQTAIHEYGHRLQSALPELDGFFRELHGRRTAGDPLESLRDITGNRAYGRDEMTRSDSYYWPYQGKEYAKGPLEVLTMAFEGVFGDGSTDLFDTDFRADYARGMYTKDREMLDLCVGLLRYWRPKKP